jgi:FtsP/CotA-like multicopper oxidase with cupredoxin domain
MRIATLQPFCRRSAAAAALAVVASLCFAAPAKAEASVQPEGWDAAVKLPEAIDTNPDPHIVEINLEARVAPVEIKPGLRVNAWTYNGGLPGPLIRVQVGDRLIVHFSNALPQPTTVHWHGVRLPIQMDGVPEISQPEVKTGGSFTYDFVVPDAGLFWYHPHVMSAAQVGFGLYGALLVEDPAERQTVGVADELVLVLSELAADDHGVFEPPDSGGSLGMVFGREGNHVLVNGRVGSRLIVRAGAPQRWRIVNAAKSRYFSLDLGTTQFTKIGGDGGLQEYAETLDTIVLAPGERADLIVTPAAAPGSELTLRSTLFNRGFGSVEARLPFDDLLSVMVADMPPVVSAARLPVRRSIDRIDAAGATAVNIDLTLAQLPDKTLEYGINGVAFSKGKPFTAKAGETQIWTVTNKTKWSHPFHLHGFFFQVLDDKGAPVHPLAWKDTVSVPFEETVRLIVRFDDREGSWMFHCHVLDHADGGLMGWVEVGTVHRSHDMQHHAGK